MGTAPETEVADAERLVELLLAALQSHQRLVQVEREFDQRLKAYWEKVSANVAHGVELARLEWEKDARVYHRTNTQLNAENDSLDRKNRRLSIQLHRAREQIALLKAARFGARKKAKR
jgi:hypothetical protein